MVKKTFSEHTSKILRALAFTGLLITIMFSSMASAITVTAEMSPEITAEYKKMLALQNWPETHTKLAFMVNPYAKVYKATRKLLKKEAPEGKRKRLMTHEESVMKAKKTRFDHCQAAVTFFVDFAKRAKTLSNVEQSPLTEDDLMAGNGVKYPFTKEETNSGTFRPTQLALTLGWKYQGKGPQYAEAFLATCLAIPVELYYKEDK